MPYRILFFLFILFSFSSWAQLKSPEEFLGYAIGSQYTPHHKIVDYFKHAEAEAGASIKLEQYGKSVEGRPLLMAYVSAANNINNLEAIRKNNLSLTGLAEQSGALSQQAPVIVWLSYNVHGNEPSSSEAAMLTLYELLKPTKPKVAEWLQHTVVLIDPCLNPDGRERYVSWFSSVVGNQYNVSTDAREHNEPWPGGRTNHYYFDLNRDWAWQTQQESKYRLRLYNRWLPQIHVDFHEQDINSPYYFAPAAQPYHEVITPWQRSFQNVIGRNHARYFDEQGWLYFTKEVFDLLYPSYGDTYPLYNGAIGMTYEQGGGPSGGLAVLTDVGDTLTLQDRAFHHFTTSLSTIEVAAQNRDKLLAEFKSFYQDATTKGVGTFKSYVVKYSATDEEKIADLKSLLERNAIRYYHSNKSSSRGYNYFNGKEESFSMDEKDLVIPALQPKGAFVKVLFEPHATLVDSLTYDITAWALPYAYGLKTYAVKQNVSFSNVAPAQHNQSMDDKAAYGYVIKWNGVKSALFVSLLQQRGVRLRYTEEPFEAGGQIFDRGSIIILKTSNQQFLQLWPMLQTMANTYKVQLYPVSTGLVDKGYDFGSARVRPLKNRRIALLTGSGLHANAVGEVWYFFDKEIKHPVTLINMRDWEYTNWRNFDVLIMPDGNYSFLKNKETADKLHDWIEGGGNVIALQDAVDQLSQLEWAIKQKKNDEGTNGKSPYDALKVYEKRERDYLPTITPGSIYKVELDNTHPLAFGYPNYYYTLKQDAHIYEFLKEDGWNVGVLKRNKPVAGFVGSSLLNRLQDGVLFGTQQIGKGSITYLADDVLFRNFWEAGKLMFCNAVFFVGQ